MRTRTRKLPAAAAAGMIALLLVSAGFGLAAKQPKIVFKEDSKDFGKIKK